MKNISSIKTKWYSKAAGRVEGVESGDSASTSRSHILEKLNMNALNIIHPYKYEDEIWVFDDAKKELIQEPFVFGADEIIEKYVASFKAPEAGFSLLFSANPFPNFDVHVVWKRADMSGNWYYDDSLDMEGWLCPALLKYFDEPPKDIYAQFREKI